MKVKRFVVLAVLGLFALSGVMASEADVPAFDSPRYTDLRNTYERSLEEIRDRCQKELDAIISQQETIAKAKLLKANLSKNAAMQADCQELSDLVREAAEAVKRGEEIVAPGRVRTANEKIWGAFLRKTANITAAASDAKAIAAMRLRDDLKRLLEADGFKTHDAERVNAFVETLLAGARDPDNGHASANETEKQDEAAQAGADLAAGDVYAEHGEADRWTRLAQIEMTSHELTIFSIKLLPLAQGVTKFSGEGIFGGKWEAGVSARREVKSLKKGTALRLKEVEGARKLEIVTWPSEENGWNLEMRAKPTGEVSQHACVIEAGL